MVWYGMVNMLLPPLLLVTTYTTTTSTFPPGLVAGGRAGLPPALVATRVNRLGIPNRFNFSERKRARHTVYTGI